ncbi:hypothetical protein Ddc_15251 [Ditylenchus destructor]|nr:hypothetical protein Ddc_15251 [Ditylenchus destructor]
MNPEMAEILRAVTQLMEQSVNYTSPNDLQPFLTSTTHSFPPVLATPPAFNNLPSTLPQYSDPILSSFGHPLLFQCLHSPVHPLPVVHDTQTNVQFTNPGVETLPTVSNMPPQFQMNREISIQERGSDSQSCSGCHNHACSVTEQPSGSQRSYRPISRPRRYTRRKPTKSETLNWVADVLESMALSIRGGTIPKRLPRKSERK